MKLYYVPRSSAGRPRWMLEELEVPYELVRLDPSKRETHTPEHRALHPLGHVPVLVDGALTMFESAAICLYLADKYPDKGMAPPVGTPARAHYYQWFSFAMTELAPAVLRILQHTAMLPLERRIASIAEDAQKALPDMLAALEAVLGKQPYMLGETFTAADVMIGGAVALASRLGGILNDYPAVDAYNKKLHERPALKRAMAN